MNFLFILSFVFIFFLCSNLNTFNVICHLIPARIWSFYSNSKVIRETFQLRLIQNKNQTSLIYKNKMLLSSIVFDWEIWIYQLKSDSSLYYICGNCCLKIRTVHLLGISDARVQSGRLNGNTSISGNSYTQMLGSSKCNYKILIFKHKLY